MSGSQFQDWQRTEANIRHDLAQLPNATTADAQRVASQEYNKISTTNPKSRYSKNFFIKEFLVVVGLALVTAIVLFAVEYHTVVSSQPVQATVESASPGAKPNTVFLLDYTIDGQDYVAKLVNAYPWQPGDSVPLLVNPQKPASAIYANEFHYFGAAFAGGLAVLFLIVTLLYFFVVAPWADRYNQRYYATQALQMQQSTPRQADIPKNGGLPPNQPS